MIKLSLSVDQTLLIETPDVTLHGAQPVLNLRKFIRERRGESVERRTRLRSKQARTSLLLEKPGYILSESLLRNLPPKLDLDKFLLYTQATPMGSSGPIDSG